MSQSSADQPNHRGPLQLPTASSGTAGMAPSNIYLDLTREFNAAGTSAIISSGQACVHYRIAFVSKDGDWILAENDQSIHQVRNVLAARAARYRLGAPLDQRWLAGGWSSHLEFQHTGWRVRTDFVSRPPRIPVERLPHLWSEANATPIPVLPIPDLIRIKRTMREKDYPIIGALALRLTDAVDILRYGQAPDSLARTVRDHPDLVAHWTSERPLLQAVAANPERIRLLLAEERIEHQRRDRIRMEAFQKAIQPFARRWQDIGDSIQRLPLPEAHPRMVEEAERYLPFQVTVP